MKKTREWAIRYGIPAAVLAVGALTGLCGGLIAGWIELRRADGEVSTLPAAEPGEGIGRNPAVALYLSPADAGEIGTALPIYTEGDGPAPEWYQPNEPMAAEWEDHFARVTEKVDGGCPDWNVDTTLWGWDGHGMEVWELDLYARIMYLEFWGTSPECCEAGADAILQLWASEYYGRTMYETLSAVTEGGAWVFSTYPAVWATEYDADGLAEMRALCEERFYNGPEWCAPFFRTEYYHPWAIPAYELDGVFFSVGKGME